MSKEQKHRKHFKIYNYRRQEAFKRKQEGCLGMISLRVETMKPLLSVGSTTSCGLRIRSLTARPDKGKCGATHWLSVSASC